METSKYKIYAVGTVAEDLIVGNKAIRVYPHEVVTNIEGDITATNSINKQAKDSENKNYNISLDESNTITATWMNPNSNRITPPNVRKGETVLIYQYADLGKFYWTTRGVELDLRGLEHVEYAYVNDPNATEMNDSNCYKVIYSTLNKLIAVRTTDNDGEATNYEQSIDTKEGIVLLILDGFGNTITLDSKAGGLVINTNAKVDIITQDANVFASNSATIETKTMTIKSDVCNINP